MTTPAITERIAAPLPSAIVEWIEAITYTSPLTIVTGLADISRLRSLQSAFVREQTTSAGTIALFYSAGRLLERLAELARVDGMLERLAELARVDGMLVVGSSANLMRTGNNYRFEDVPASLGGGVDFALDRDPTRFHRARSSRRRSSISRSASSSAPGSTSPTSRSHGAGLGATAGDRKARSESARSIADL